MGPIANNTQFKDLIFEIDYFQINYTIYQSVNTPNGENYTIKWEVDQNFDVSTDNICAVSLVMVR